MGEKEKEREGGEEEERWENEVEEGKMIEVILIYSSGADPALEDSQKWLAIHYASDGGHKESVKAILSHPKGLTGLKLALSFAEANGRADIVSIIKSAIER